MFWRLGPVCPLFCSPSCSSSAFHHELDGHAVLHIEVLLEFFWKLVSNDARWQITRSVYRPIISKGGAPEHVSQSLPCLLECIVPPYACSKKEPPIANWTLYAQFNKVACMQWLRMHWWYLFDPEHVSHNRRWLGVLIIHWISWWTDMYSSGPHENWPRGMSLAIGRMTAL